MGHCGFQYRLNFGIGDRGCFGNVVIGAAMLYESEIRILSSKVTYRDSLTFIK